MGYYELVNCCKDCQERFIGCQTVDRCAKWKAKEQAQQERKARINAERVTCGYICDTSTKLKSYYTGKNGRNFK